MIRNGARYEAHTPNDLIGWQILEITKDTDGNMVKVTMSRNIGGEVRACWVDKEVIPLFSMERNYNYKEGGGK